MGSDSRDYGTEVGESLIDVLIATVDLLDVVDGADAIGRKGSNEQSHAGRARSLWFHVVGFRGRVR